MTVTATDEGRLQAELLEYETLGTSSGGRSVTHRASGVVLCSALLFGGTGTMGPPNFDFLTARCMVPVTSPASSQTTSGSAVRAESMPSVPSRLRREGDEIRWLHAASGLTWEQLGRVLGVSRRAVHLWATGARTNAANAEAVFALADLVRSSPGSSADDRRAWLLRPEDGGMSRLDRFRRARGHGVQINRPLLRAADVVDTPTTLEVSES